MKNQNDLIFSIVFGVLGLIAVGVAYATKPEVPSIPAPPVVNVAPAPLPTTAVVYGNGLPGGAAAGGGGGRGPSGFGGPSGFAGPPGGFGGPGGRGGPPGMSGAPPSAGRRGGRD